MQLEKNNFGFYSVKNMPTKEELTNYYANKYFQNSNIGYRQTYTKDELIYFENRAKIAEYILPKSSNSLLDVGCGEGFFAKYFFEKNWQITTLDYSSYGISTQNPQLINTHIAGDVFETLESITKKQNKYDLINLSHVLEHVIDPISLLKSLKNLMNENSYLRICVPNDFSDFQEFLLKKEYTSNTWVCIPDHLHYFTFKSLESLICSLDFEVVVSLGEFPIEIFIANEKSNYTKDKNLGASAHKARVEIDNFMFETQSLEDYVDYYKASAKIGFSRQIVLFVKLK